MAGPQRGGPPLQGGPPLCALRGAPLFEGDLREEGGQTLGSGHSVIILPYARGPDQCEEGGWLQCVCNKIFLIFFLTIAQKLKNEV